MPTGVIAALVSEKQRVGSGASSAPQAELEPRRSRRVLKASDRNSALQIIPGEVAGEKGSLEVFEVGGPAGNHGKY